MTKPRKTNNAQQPRKRRRLNGRGDYTTDVSEEPDLALRLEKKIDHLERKLVGTKPSVGSAASMAGRALGSLVGQGDLGSMAGSALAKFFGHGDYHVGTNSLMPNAKNPEAGPPPLFVARDGRRGTRFVEREFIMDVTSGTLNGGATQFTNSSFTLDPTDYSTFPWLSTIANLYDQWEPNGIVFEFVSTSSDYAASQALGAVIMATDYDPSDAPYTTKSEMENSDYACSIKPSCNLMHGIECDPRERPLKVLYTSSPTPAFQSLGNFQVATAGCATAGVKLGELWISYDITFYKKQLFNAVANIPILNFTGTQVPGGPFFPAANTVLVQRYISIDNTVVGASSIVFPPGQSDGRYIINLYTLGTVAPTLTPTGCTLVSNLRASPLTDIVVQLTAPNARINFGLANSNAAAYTVLVYQVPPGVGL